MMILFYAPLETFAQPTGTGVYISNLLNALLEIDRSNCYIVWHGCMVKIPPHLQPFRPPTNLQDRVAVRISRFPTRLFHHLLQGLFFGGLVVCLWLTCFSASHKSFSRPFTLSSRIAKVL